MGQYRQWLHHRDIDQLLRAQLVTLHKELAQLNERIDDVAQETSLTTDNAIVQALITQHYTPQTSTISEVPIAKAENLLQEPSASATQTTTVSRQNTATGSVSSALFAWGRLPNFDSQDIQTPLLRPVPAPRPIPPTPRPTDDLLPDDISAFVNTYDQTAPQLKLPWWLRSTLNNAQNPHAGDDEQQSGPGAPVDTQSNRTNQLVQRWFERRRRFAQQLQERREQGTE